MRSRNSRFKPTCTRLLSVKEGAQSSTSLLSLEVSISTALRTISGATTRLTRETSFCRRNQAWNGIGWEEALEVLGAYGRRPSSSAHMKDYGWIGVEFSTRSCLPSPSGAAISARFRLRCEIQLAAASREM